MLTKHCRWDRHGAYKTIKIIEHTAKILKGAENPRTVKRITIIEQCGFCGKMIITDNY